MASATDPFITNARSSYDDLPDRLTRAEETRAIDALSDWFDRLQAVRAAYERGEIDRDEIPARVRARGAAFHLTQMTEAEREAAHRLYAASARLVAAIVTRQTGTSNDERVRDMLACAYEAFLRSLSAYDPDRGARISTWITRDMGRELQRAYEAPDAAEKRIEDLDEDLPAPTDMATALADVLDIDALARAVAAEHDNGLDIWNTLTAPEDASPQQD